MTDLEIIIKRKPKSGGKRRRGPIAQPERKKYLPRRLRSNGITFYDLGQKLVSDQWEDINYFDYPAIDVSIGHPSGLLAYGLSRWNDLEAKVFEVSVEDFKTTYRKLSFADAEKYYIDLYTGDSTAWVYNWDPAKWYSAARDGSRRKANGDVVAGGYWTEKGLTLPFEINDFALRETALFAGIRGQKKITAVRNYGASSVAGFKLSNSAEMFLMPRPLWVYGNDGGFDLQNRHGFYGMMFSTLPREWMVNNSAISDSILQSQFANLQAFAPEASTFWSPFTGGNLNAITEGGAIFSEYQNQAGMRYFVFRAGYVSPSTFPAAGWHYVIHYGTSGSNNWGDVSVSKNAGALLAVIKQGGEWFYVWQSSTVSSEGVFVAFGGTV